MYIVGQYMAKQPSLRMSYGQSWIYLGFRKTFQHLIGFYGYERALKIWIKLLANPAELPDPGRQQRLRQHRLTEKTQGVSGNYLLQTRQTLITSSKFIGYLDGYGAMPPIINIFNSGPWYRACKTKKDGQPIPKCI